MRRARMDGLEEPNHPRTRPRLLAPWNLARVRLQLLWPSVSKPERSRGYDPGLPRQENI